MQFIYPTFLYALLTVSIPIIIHLFRFRNYKKFVFSDIRFLKQVVEQNQKQRTIREWLVLACRVFALAALVFAFARPYIPLDEKTNLKGLKAVSVFVDNSFSMNQNGRDGELFETAKNKAREIVSFYNEDDLFQLLSNDFEGKHQRLLSKKDFLFFLDELKTSSKSKKINEIISRQKQAFENLKDAQKTVFIISDFQASQFNQNLEEDSTIELQFVSIEPNLQSNISIDSVWFSEPIIKANSPLKLMARVKNYSSEKVDDIALLLKINKVQKAMQNISCNAFDFADVEINFSLGNNDWQKAELSIIDNPVTFDDKLFFAFKPNSNLDVLIINSGQQNGFMTNVFQSETFFNVSQTNQNNIDYSKIAKQSLIVLNELSELSSGFQQELKKYVEEGGNIFVIPPTESENINKLNEFIQSLFAANFGNQIVQKVQVNEINLNDELFQNVFSKLPNSVDLPYINKLYELQISNAIRGNSILKLNNGNSFVFKSNYMKGCVYSIATPLQNEWSNFQQHALFVPFVLRMPMANKKSEIVYHTIGYNTSASVELNENENLLHVVNEKMDVIIEAGNNFGKSFLPLNSITDAGVYEVKNKNKNVMAAIAMNYPRSESDSKLLSKVELQKLSINAKINFSEGNLMELQKRIEAEENGIQLWRWFVIAALFFIAMEMALLLIKNKVAA